MAPHYQAFILLITTLLYTSIEGDKKDIGVCYGFNGDNLPSPRDVVNLYKKYEIGKIRLFEPNPEMLQVLKGSDIDVVLGVANQDIANIATSLAADEQWFMEHLQPYIDGITVPIIALGNEVVPGQYSESILPAMQNLQTVLQSHNLDGIKTSTVVSMDVLVSTYPPSAATFSAQAQPIMSGIINFLSSQGSPLLINVYPYFAYASDPINIRLDYTQFTATGEPVVRDMGLSYMNMFDAMVDSFIWAMEKLGVTNVQIVVAESGWPHDANGQYTTVDLAMTYNKNFMQHVTSNVGTPKRPNAYIEGFIFSMIDENRKPVGVEQFFGMFKPNMEPNYDIFS